MKRSGWNRLVRGFSWSVARAVASRVVALVLLFACVNSLVPPIDLSATVRASLAATDAASTTIQRFECLKGHLPEDRVLGYWGSPQLQVGDPMDYFLINYSLAPHVFVKQQVKWMVLNFPNWKSALRGVMQFPGYRIEHDCENGILLILSAG